MDFLKIIRALEEFLYEAMTWLFFYPRTFWRCVCHPDWIIAYTDQELGESPGEQFKDLISPPLFLIISVLIAHGVQFLLRNRPQASASPVFNEIAATEQGLILFRALLFSVFPLVARHVGRTSARARHSNQPREIAQPVLPAVLSHRTFCRGHIDRGSAFSRQG